MRVEVLPTFTETTQPILARFVARQGRKNIIFHNITIFSNFNLSLFSRHPAAAAAKILGKY